MKISVIITTYNNPLFLKKVLESFLHQERAPDELLIADDGSSNETALLIRQTAESAPFPIKHIWQEDNGFRAAKIRNAAINNASGEYIIIIDGDCVVNKNFVSDHALLAEEKYFLQGKRVLVNKNAADYFDYKHANSSKNLVTMALTGKLGNRHHLLHFKRYPAIKNRKLKGIKSCNMGFFKQDIFAVNGFNEDFIGWGNEDSDLVCRLLQYGLTKKVHPFMAICFHLWHPANKTVNEHNKQLLAQTIASKQYYCANGLIKKI
jgi:glycosyltransferase involved in cell wall biosynthesis